ncbi:probable sodium/metabolite cotransporter BASS4, chloroplastic isoform X2 [Dioscorea cayenensis subsp. rotundata]|uniref:Probable sodium/metabolite cotransporter BASS4, chloroplastic isoform X2 n=1 Tax=Dioscorea cayennensis subsp. rotundata TaxID=55577 RepID=A0AB40C185_DIOCR|nr:probable sodium/metabolite cotransporter BASS4, chloroplastic isoform X2 [Dioscorea cayenensis subsp. rotundata]
MAVRALRPLYVGPRMPSGNGGIHRHLASHSSTPIRCPGVSPFPLLFPSYSRESRQEFRRLRAFGGSDQVNGRGDQHLGHSNSLDIFSWARPLLDFAAKNFLPLALVCGVAFGVADPTLGCLAHKYSLSRVSTFGIFFISGLTLQSREIDAAIEAWPAGLFGLSSILLFTPLFSRLILQLKLVPQEFVTGVAVFCCMPTTLSSGIALTQLAGGNSALALAMTVISNMLGIMIVPFSLSIFIMTGRGVSVPTLELFRSLFNTLLVPLVLGKRCHNVKDDFDCIPIWVQNCLNISKVLRDILSGVAKFVDQNRHSLSMVPWIQVSRSRPLLLSVNPASFAIAISLGALLHLALLALNMLAMRSLSALSGGSRSVFSKKDNARAVIIVASQKTLPVMVAVVEQLNGALGESGLLILPCVASHIIQIIIDSFLVNMWTQKDQHSNETKEV